MREDSFKLLTLKYQFLPQLYGGIERIIDLLVTGLQARGHIVGLVAHRDSTSPATQLFPWPGLRSQHKLDALRNTLALSSAVKAIST